jgi:hypothetical protein
MTVKTLAFEALEKVNRCANPPLNHLCSSLPAARHATYVPLSSHLALAALILRTKYE